MDAKPYLREKIRRRTVLVAAAWLAGCGGCGPSAGSGELPSSSASPVASHVPWFDEATARAGLDFTHDAGPVGKYWMPQSIGSGAALLDFDNDGRLDVLLLQNSGRKPTSANRLFRQTSDQKFVDVTAGSGLGTVGQAMGAAVGDVNNDGWIDVLVTEFGRLRLFVNRGNGAFQETAEAAGLISPLWACSASFFDYDRDGWLDLVVANYVAYDPSRPCHNAGGVPDFCPPKEFEGTVTKLFRNESGKHDASNLKHRVSFRDVTLAAGLGQTPGPGLGVVCADLSGDHWPDIFVANDGQPNRLWINQRNGTFRDEALLRGVALNGQSVAEASMGVALGDVDGQHGPDLFVTHLTEERHTLWRQEAPGVFQDRTAASRIARPESRGTGFGTVLADFDLDGDLDLAIANGRVSRGAVVDRQRLGDFWSSYAERCQVFANDGSGAFDDVSPHNDAVRQPAGVYRGLACGDIDNDGDVDLLITAVAGRARLLRNSAVRQGRWLVVRATTGSAPRDAHGAEITVHAGGRRWTRIVQPGYSYLCSNDPRCHFGLGAVNAVEHIEILWPDGSAERFDGAVDRLLTLHQGTGKGVAP